MAAKWTKFLLRPFHTKLASAVVTQHTVVWFFPIWFKNFFLSRFAVVLKLAFWKRLIQGCTMSAPTHWELGDSFSFEDSPCTMDMNMTDFSCPAVNYCSIRLL
jgi:hypothetical protein